jgi:hypothetical protein
VDDLPAMVMFLVCAVESTGDLVAFGAGSVDLGAKFVLESSLVGTKIKEASRHP